MTRSDKPRILAPVTKARKPKAKKNAAFSYCYPLFCHMAKEHGLTLLDSELDEICRVVLQMRVPQNWLDPLLSGSTRALTGSAGKWGCKDIENLLNALRTGKMP